MNTITNFPIKPHANGKAKSASVEKCLLDLGNGSVRISIGLRDEAGVIVGREFCVIDGKDYSGWLGDDSYIIAVALKKLGIVPVAAEPEIAAEKKAKPVKVKTPEPEA